MPREASFFSEGPESRSSGNEWKIRGQNPFVSSAFPKPTTATRGDRTIQIGYAVEDADRFIGLCYFNNNYPVYKLVMPTSNGLTIFTIRAPFGGQITIEPKSLRIQKGNRVEVDLEGVGKAIYRHAWKDSDAKERIIGFVDASCLSPEFEEDLVWLAGTLGCMYLPQPPSG